MGPDVSGTWTMYDEHSVKRGTRYRRGSPDSGEWGRSRPSVIESFIGSRFRRGPDGHFLNKSSTPYRSLLVPGVFILVFLFHPHLFYESQPCQAQRTVPART